MSQKIKITDQVTFDFAGSKLSGLVIELYTRSNKKMALVKSKAGHKYPVEVEFLTKL